MLSLATLIQYQPMFFATTPRQPIQTLSSAWSAAICSNRTDCSPTNSTLVSLSTPQRHIKQLVGANHRQVILNSGVS